jgi:hypothetical protein
MGQLTREDVKQIAEENWLGRVQFTTKTAANTGREMQVAYVFPDPPGSGPQLFAKASRNSGFCLCNEFRSLAPNDGEGPL